MPSRTRRRSRRSAQVVAPRFEAATLDGGRTSLDELLAPGLPLLLVTLSPGCGPCKTLRPDVATWAHDLFDDRLTVAVLATGLARGQPARSYADEPELTVVVDAASGARHAAVGGAPPAVRGGWSPRTAGARAGSPAASSWSGGCW